MRKTDKDWVKIALEHLRAARTDAPSRRTVGRKCVNRPDLDWKNKEEKVIYDQFGHDRKLRVFAAGVKKKEVLANYRFAKELFPDRSLGLVDMSYYFEFIELK